MSKIPELRDIKSVLKKSFGEDIDVTVTDATLLTAPGENYGSVMIAVDTEIKHNGKEPKRMHFVAKLCPANEMLCKLFNIQETFKKELSMYLQTVPAIEEFENEYGIKEYKMSDLFAKCFGGRINMKPGNDEVDEDALLLLENLKVAGYDVGDRLIGFDLEHCELILQNLAHFHAVPIAFKILKPEIFKEKILPSIKSVKVGELEEDSAEQLTSEILNIIKSNPEFETYSEMIGDSIRLALAGEYRFLPATEPFSTIVHGDFWVNNTMVLRNESGKPIHNKVVDLQLQIHHSLVLDLLFFFYSSVIPTVLQDNYDHFIELYYNSFIKCLKQFDLDLTPFSWDNFVKEIADIAPIVLGQILFMLKPLMKERGQIKDMAEMDEESLVRTDLVSPEFRKRVIITIKSFIDHKWI